MRSRRGGRDDAAKREVYARGANLWLFGDSMHPCALDRGVHHEEASVLEEETHGLRGSRALARPHVEAARGAERDGCDDGIGAELRFVVGVEAHGVVAIAMQIEEHAVEAATDGGFDARAKRCDRVGPRRGMLREAAVRV